MADLKRSLSDGAGGGSDHLALVRAYNEWAALPAHAQRAFAARNYMSYGTLTMIHGMREQLVSELRARGLVESTAAASRHADDPALVRCVLVRGREGPRRGGVGRLPRPRSSLPSVSLTRRPAAFTPSWAARRPASRAAARS